MIIIRKIFVTGFLLFGHRLLCHSLVHSDH